MYKKIIFIALLFVGTLNAYAVENLGTHGKTYPVVENDFYQWLMGKLEKKAQEYIPPTEDEVRRMVEKKLYVDGFDNISKCQDNSTREVDLTVILEHDIKDPSGNILFSKGTVVNPFDYNDMKRNYFFLDVDNLTQVKKYLEVSQSSQIQPMATAGNLSFFYQNTARSGKAVPAGKTSQLMIDRFQIRCTPTLVRQKDKKIEVIEYYIEDVK
jgi:hypothetical protein